MKTKDEAMKDKLVSEAQEDRQRREEADRASIRGARVISAPDTPPLLSPQESVELPAVGRFVDKFMSSLKSQKTSFADNL